eukprot:scaffold1307_cov200-Pinguiococcus_pyrenoidosus.AAC.66
MITRCPATGRSKKVEVTTNLGKKWACERRLATNTGIMRATRSKTSKEQLVQPAPLQPVADQRMRRSGRQPSEAISVYADEDANTSLGFQARRSPRGPIYHRQDVQPLEQDLALPVLLSTGRP